MCTQLKLGLAVALAVGWMATDALAQQGLLRRERNQQQGSQQIQQTAGTSTDTYAGTQSSVDKQFAACLLQANQAEVKLAKIAAEKAESPAVKQFAEQMIQDHTALANKLEQFVGTQRPSDRRSQIERQINDRCLAMLEQELESKTGREFDACYLGSQVAGHMHMKAALEVLASETDGQLQQTVQDAQPTIDKHYKHAQDLMRQVDQRQVSVNN